MRWFKPNLRSSIYALFSAHAPSPPTETETTIDIEDIREAMLALIIGVGDNRLVHVTRRVRYASDVQALWFLRGDLMAILASTYGESLARAKLEVVSDMFHDMLPQGLRSRPSPLSSR
jgi:hypothetical protein